MVEGGDTLKKLIQIFLCIICLRLWQILIAYLLQFLLWVYKSLVWTELCSLTFIFKRQVPDRGPENANASAVHTGVWGTATRATGKKELDRGKLLHYRCNGQQGMDARRNWSVMTCFEIVGFHHHICLRKTFHLPPGQPGVYMCSVQWTVQYLSCYGV